MRAKLVNENIEFKRGINPQDSLNIGKGRKIENPTTEDYLNLRPGKYLFIKSSYNGEYKLFNYGTIPKYRKTFGIRMLGTWQHSMMELEEYSKHPEATVFWHIEDVDSAILSIQKIK